MFYHMKQLEDLGRVANTDRTSHYFVGVKVKEGEKPTEKPFPKSDYLRVEGDFGYLADDSESYRDVMDFQREWSFLRRS